MLKVDDGEKKAIYLMTLRDRRRGATSRPNIAESTIFKYNEVCFHISGCICLLVRE